MQTQLKSIELKQAISTKQSQALVKDLVSISLNCITFLRNIFGDENYVDKKFICSENPNIKSGFVKTKHLVEGISKEADMFKNWIDCGVNNAISLQYLLALQFGIYIDENQPETLSETYIFKFDYNNGNISFGINDEEKCEPLLELNAREKVQQLIKRLIVLTQTFGPLPEKKHISVRLLFNDKCPKDYQPSFFKDASNLESPTITVDVGNSSNNIGTLDTGHDKVNIKILTNVGVQITNPLNVDPFYMVEDNENYDPHKFENHIEFPKANNSLSLNKYLFSNKQDNIHSTQLVPPSQLFYSGNFKLTCECNCWGSASRIKLSMKGFAILTCRICQRQVHSCCYGMNHSKPIKKSTHTFKCYSCMLNTDSLDEDLILLMRLRYLWKYMSCYDIPELLDLFYDIFSLATNDDDDDVVRKMLNKLFHDKILIVLDKPVIVRGNKNAMGTGYLTPRIDLLLDNKGNSLVKNHTYNIAFTPTVKSPNLMCHTDKQMFYLPDTYNTKSHILSLLQEFKTSLLKNQEFDDDPIESSSPIFNTKTCTTINRGEFTKPVDQTRTNHSNENLVEDDMDELSFEDSLNFLSQPVNNQDSEGVNFLQDKVNQAHVLTSKRKLDSSLIIGYKVKNRKISVNEDTCF